MGESVVLEEGRGREGGMGRVGERSDFTVQSEEGRGRKE